MERSLEARLQELEDLRAIENLIHLYGFLIDTARFAEIASLFVEDGILDYGSGEFRGQTAIREFYCNYPIKLLGTAHHVSNLYIRINGDIAHSLCRTLAFHWNTQDKAPPDFLPTDLMMTGGYQDSFRRENMKWRFVKRLPLISGTGVGVEVGDSPLKVICKDLWQRSATWPDEVK
jgi:SnoaL-like domain